MNFNGSVEYYITSHHTYSNDDDYVCKRNLASQRAVWLVFSSFKVQIQFITVILSL